ncbi:GAF domain-containing protein [Kribbella sp. VKM Ac-2527]|uniref:GAF domain-containing protein n=1 Tax=Kribbella caucasensis TaxID=2512215 RepID=A0A4R6KFI0_9ACTN|nr:LuxR C-terminal-related transcriptional regulator [Kribbella sp. VKM Ac-2527]TDO46866.1 GAF domain-containing protein [Kribbella sp. VKM Ac-2527]
MIGSTAVGDAHEALRCLRSMDSVSELVESVPAVAHRLGFNRVLLSRLRGTTWTARSGYVAGDTTMTQEMIRIGVATPGRTDAGWPEGDVVRRRLPVLVHDAQTNPRVHPQLKALMSTRDYVAAPLVAEDAVVGLLHADQNGTSGGLTELDRDLLGLFAEGLGFVFERAILREQLITLKCRLDEQARSVGDLIDGLRDSDVLGPERPLTPRQSYVVSGPLAELTRRELEVLRHLAAGESNDQIAARLYISAGTVKTHIKHVLHKLGTVSRAEAIARYHHLTP